MPAVVTCRVLRSYMENYYFVTLPNNLVDLYPELENEEGIKAKVLEARVDNKSVEEPVGKEFVLKLNKVSELSYHLVLPEDMIKIMREYDFPDKFTMVLELTEGVKTGVKIFPKGRVNLY